MYSGEPRHNVAIRVIVHYERNGKKGGVHRGDHGEGTIQDLKKAYCDYKIRNHAGIDVPPVIPHLKYVVSPEQKGKPEK